MRASLEHYSAYHNPHTDWNMTDINRFGNKNTTNLLGEQKCVAYIQGEADWPPYCTAQYALSSVFYGQSWLTWWNVKWESVNRMSTAVCSAGQVWEAQFDSVVRNLSAVLASRDKTIANSLAPIWWFSCWVVSNSCDPMDCSLPGSSVHRIFHARILEWVVISFSRGIFPTQGLNLSLLHCRQILYWLSYQGRSDPL